MKKLTKENDGLLIGALMFGYYQVELEGYGIFSFQHRDYNGRLYDFWEIDAMEEVRV